MRFSTGDCGTEFIPATIRLFSDIPEWKKHYFYGMGAFRWRPRYQYWSFFFYSVFHRADRWSGIWLLHCYHSVTYTATDENGIVTSCTFNVTARDVEKPVLSLELATALDASQIAEIGTSQISHHPYQRITVVLILRSLGQTVLTCSDADNEIHVTVTDVNGNVSTETLQ
jgi:hypothetical protein